jgi:flavin reductase (DIM6/NTAB) family NADH-FMN oxidoreductase RutF
MEDFNMAKQSWKPGNMLYPVPAVLVSCRDKKGNDNVLTIAWAGTVCSDPAMLSISVRKERHSYPMIKESGEFVVNLTTRALLEATDYCGVKSGRDEDKFAAMHLTKGAAEKVNAPIIMESPVNIECKVKQVLELGSHDMFVAEVVNVQISEELLDENGKFHLEAADLVAYSHGEYYELGEKLGTFGFSVKKK